MTRSIVLVLGIALAMTACGEEGEDAAPAETRPAPTTTAPGESTSTTAAPAGSTSTGPPSPQEAALLAEAAEFFEERPGWEAELLDTTRGLCGSLDELSEGRAGDFILMSLFDSYGDEAGTILAQLAVEHLCPQHTATVEGFIASRAAQQP